MIIRVYYTNVSSSENGWRLALWFSVVLNVNLALINMLPFPVLDGGHIMLALVEASGAGRSAADFETGCRPPAPWSSSSRYMLYIAFFDIRRLAAQDAKEMEFAPPKAPRPRTDICIIASHPIFTAAARPAK